MGQLITYGLRGIVVINSESPAVPTIGIPVNIGIALVTGIAVGLIYSSAESGFSTGLMYGLVAAFFLQEIILVQYLSRDANVHFQERLFQGKVNHSNRFTMLFFPPALLVTLGLVIAIFSPVDIDVALTIRIICVSLIIMFGIDPLYGLYDRGVLAVFGASVVYVLILQAGFGSSGEFPNLISPVIGMIPAISLTTTLVTYLLLSTRWTYYRLFCFNQMNNLGRVFMDTGLPLLFVLIPFLPKFFGILSFIYLGI